MTMEEAAALKQGDLIEVLANSSHYRKGDASWAWTLGVVFHVRVVRYDPYAGHELSGKVFRCDVTWREAGPKLDGRRANGKLHAPRVVGEYHEKKLRVALDVERVTPNVYADLLEETGQQDAADFLRQRFGEQKAPALPTRFALSEIAKLWRCPGCKVKGMIGLLSEDGSSIPAFECRSCRRVLRLTAGDDPLGDDPAQITPPERACVNCGAVFSLPPYGLKLCPACLNHLATHGYAIDTSRQG